MLFVAHTRLKISKGFVLLFNQNICITLSVLNKKYAVSHLFTISSACLYSVYDMYLLFLHVEILDDDAYEEVERKK